MGGFFVELHSLFLYNIYIEINPRKEVDFMPSILSLTRWSENFSEEYPITLFEEEGGIYQQNELLHEGKHGNFFSCTLYIDNYIYEGISYIAPHGVRVIYSLESCKDLSGNTVRQNAGIHLQNTMRSSVIKQGSPAAMRKMICYLILYTLSFILSVAMFVFLAGALWNLLPVFIVTIRTLAYLFIAVMMFILSKLLIRYRKYAF